MKNIPIAKSYFDNRELDLAAQVIRSGWIAQGTMVERFEGELAAYLGARHAVAVSSGTSALHIALIIAGVGPRDAVIVPSFSFIATANAVAHCGAKPVFIDIEPDTYNIDPKLVEAALTPRTKAIVPVHLFGQLADMDPIMEIARRRGVKVIEDAAQAIGAEYKGRQAGSIGDLGCFSFYPSKNLGGGGDGGMIVTNDDQVEKNCRSLRVHGENPKYFHHMIGYNSRLDTLQAAMLLVKLPHLRAWSEKRIEHARIYEDAFVGLPNLRVPLVKGYSTFHIFNQYTLASQRRDLIIEGLNHAGIGNCIYYPVPFHQQKCFAYLDYAPGDFPVSSQAAAEVFSIPIYPEMTPAEQQEVIATVRRLATEP